MAEPTDQPWTVLRLLDWTREHFERQNVDSPRLAAEMLLAKCLECQRIELYTRFDAQPSARQIAAYRQAVRQAAEHYPVAYLVGEKEFYSLAFEVCPDVLIPRPETELLVGAAVEHLRGISRPGRVWDVCTGSGCVGIAIASQVETAEVIVSDISGEAVAVARRNAEAHHLADRVRCIVADLLHWPADAGEFQPVDVITANPPYVADAEDIAESVKHEPQVALFAGPDGLAFIRRIVADAPARLVAGGIFAMEFGLTQADDVRDLIDETDAFDEPRFLRDHQDLERTAVAVRL